MIIIMLFFGVFFTSTLLVSLSSIANPGAGMIDGETYLFIPFIVQGIGYTIVWAYWDSMIQIKGIHFWRSFWKLVLFSILPVILWIQQGDSRNLYLIPYSVAMYIAIFDYFYNRFKGMGPFYVGTQALTDRIVRFINKSETMLNLYPVWYIFVRLFIVILILKLSGYYYLHG